MLVYIQTLMLVYAHMLVYIYTLMLVYIYTFRESTVAPNYVRIYIIYIDIHAYMHKHATQVRERKFIPCIYIHSYMHIHRYGSAKSSPILITAAKHSYKL